MKLVTFLAIAVVAVASLPLDEKSPDIPDDANVELEKINGKIVIVIKGKNGSTWKRVIVFRDADDDGERRIDLADLPPAELAKLTFRIGGVITGTLELADAALLEEGEAELALDENSVRTRNGGIVRFDERELNGLVARELARLGLKNENAAENAMRIVGPVEMENVEILPSPPIDSGSDSPSDDDDDLAQIRIRISKGKIRIKGKIKIKGSIKIGIRFSGLATEESAEPREAPIWIRDSRSESVRVGGAVRFNAEELDEAEVEDVEVAPVAESAEEENRLGGSILIGGSIRFRDQEDAMEEEEEEEEDDKQLNDLADLSTQDPIELRIRIRGKIKIKFSSPRVATEAHEELSRVGIVRLDGRELRELVAQRLAAENVDVPEDAIELMRFVGPVRMSEVEILPSIAEEEERQAMIDSGSDSSSSSSSDEDDLAQIRIRIRGNIKIGIKFSAVGLDDTATMEEEEGDDGESVVWMRVEGDNEGGTRGDLRDATGEVEEIEVEEIEVVPDPTTPELE